MIRSIVTAALAIGSLVGAFPVALAQGNLVPCAEENGYCRVPYPTRVFYGVPGSVVGRDVDQRGVQCSNEIFGDPAPHSTKSCSYVARGGGVELPPRGPDRRSPAAVVASGSRLTPGTPDQWGRQIAVDRRSGLYNGSTLMTLITTVELPPLAAATVH